MRSIIFCLLILFFNFILIWNIFWQSDSIQQAEDTLQWSDDPGKLIDNLKDNNIQNTALDKTSYIRWSGIKSTLQTLADNLNPYLNWIIFVALVVGTILIMFNGIELMKNASTGKDGEIWKIKTRMLNITIWIAIVVGFTVIVKIFVAIINAIFK